MSIECLQCKNFDLETQRRMRELFSSEEIVLITMNLAGFLKIMTDTASKMDQRDIRRLQITGQRDFAGKIIGKFMVSLDPEGREKMIDAAKRTIGVQLNVNHEACPHVPPETVA